MKLTLATFTFDDETVVRFYGDEVVVRVRGRKLKTFDNPVRKYGGRDYKPCVSHCETLIRKVKVPGRKRQTRWPVKTYSLSERLDVKPLQVFKEDDHE